MEVAAPRLRLDTRDLDALRATLGAMIRDGHADDALDLVVELLAALRDQNDVLQVRLRTALRQLYGRRSEKLSPDQLSLFARLLGDDLPATTPAAATPDAATPPPAGGATGAGTGTRGRAHGRGEMPADLPRRTTRVPVPDAARACRTCGGAMAPFGADTHWRVEFHPGQFVVEVTECEKVACPRCRDAVATAPAPGAVIPGRPVGPGLLAKVLVDKGEDHLPLERQQRRLAREGYTVPTTTLEGWWAQGADLLAGLHRALVDEALGAWLPQLDATGLDVLDRDDARGVRLGHVWTAVGGRAVAFVYASGKSNGLKDLLVQRCGDAAVGGPIQCDGETLFSSVQLRAGKHVVLVHCHMHARRYAERALKSGDLRAARPMQLWTQLYDVERRATADGVGPEERARRRQVEALPLLEALRQWALDHRDAEPPTSPLGKAIRYLERRWLSLVVYVLDGRIALDTGEVERQIRRIAVGRRNWLFCGSDAGARRVAIVASLCATCRRLGIDPWAYLRAVFVAIADGISGPRLVADFTPWAWAEKQPQQPHAQPIAPAS
jgi:transposase